MGSEKGKCMVSSRNSRGNNENRHSFPCRNRATKREKYDVMVLREWELGIQRDYIMGENLQTYGGTQKE